MWSSRHVLAVKERKPLLSHLLVITLFVVARSREDVGSRDIAPSFSTPLCVIAPPNCEAAKINFLTLVA